jgi:hypothetical protein
MKPVATSPEQLTSQVHRLSFASPRLENPGCLAPGEDVKRSNPAMFVTTDARSATNPIAPSVPQEVVCLTFAAGDVCPASSLRTGAIRCIGLQCALAHSPSLEDLPNEVLFHIMGFLDVNDLLSTSRVSIDYLPLARIKSTFLLTFWDHPRDLVGLVLIARRLGNPD